MKVGYCRVSTKEQGFNSHALEQQIERIKSQGVEKIYKDIESGTKDKRKSYQQLLEDIKTEKVSEIIITRLDRLTRKLKTQIEIIELIQKHNVVLKVLDQEIDTSTASGRMHLNMLGVISQNEVEQNSERIKHGWEHFRKNKKIHCAPFGYLIKDGKLFFDTDPFVCNITDERHYSKYDIATLLINMFFEEKSLRKTLIAFNTKFGIQEQKGKKNDRTELKFAVSTLTNWINNPVIRGHVTYFRKSKNKPTEIYYNQHPAILSDEKYAEILEILEGNKKTRGWGEYSPKYPLSGLIVCKDCGYNMLGSWAGDYFYYRCRHSQMKTCDNKKWIRVDRIEPVLIDALKNKYQEISQLATNFVPPVNPKIIELQQQISTLKSLPSNPILNDAINKLELQIEQLQFNQSQSQLINQNQSELLKQVFSSSGFWDSLLLEDKREIYHKLVSKIIVNQGEIVDIILKI